MKLEKEKLSKSQFNDLSVNDLYIIHIISLTGSIDKLERLGYIERVPSKTDRRVTNIRFNKKGRLLSQLHNREHVAFTNSLLSYVSSQVYD